MNTQRVPPDEPKVFGVEQENSSPFSYEPPVDWWRLDDAERGETLAVVAEFTGELARMYGLREAVLPPCWYLHSAIIQELLALFQYRNQQQYLPISPPGAAIDFHIQLSACLTRLRSWVLQSQCNQREHNASEFSVWARTGSDAARSWQENFEMYLTQMRGHITGEGISDSVGVGGWGEDVAQGSL